MFSRYRSRHKTLSFKLGGYYQEHAIFKVRQLYNSHRTRILEGCDENGSRITQDSVSYLILRCARPD
jgi:hypothetical protein